jgi:hypothetical protein
MAHEPWDRGGHRRRPPEEVWEEWMEWTEGRAGAIDIALQRRDAVIAGKDPNQEQLKVRLTVVERCTSEARDLLIADFSKSGVTFSANLWLLLLWQATMEAYTPSIFDSPLVSGELTAHLDSWLRHKVLKTVKPDFVVEEEFVEHVMDRVRVKVLSGALTQCKSRLGGFLRTLVTNASHDTVRQMLTRHHDQPVDHSRVTADSPAPPDEGVEFSMRCRMRKAIHLAAQREVASSKQRRIHLTAAGAVVKERPLPRETFCAVAHDGYGYTIGELKKRLGQSHERITIWIRQGRARIAAAYSDIGPARDENNG